MAGWAGIAYQRRLQESVDLISSIVIRKSERGRDYDRSSYSDMRRSDRPRKIDDDCQYHHY